MKPTQTLQSLSLKKLKQHLNLLRFFDFIAEIQALIAEYEREIDRRNE